VSRVSLQLDGERNLWRRPCYNKMSSTTLPSVPPSPPDVCCHSDVSARGALFVQSSSRLPFWLGAWTWSLREEKGTLVARDPCGRLGGSRPHHRGRAVAVRQHGRTTGHHDLSPCQRPPPSGSGDYPAPPRLSAHRRADVTDDNILKKMFWVL
jgi:hypothetical protein